MPQESALSLVLAKGGRSLLAILAVTASLIAAILHFAVAQVHFEESTGQGLFMLSIALLQLGWAITFFRRATPGSYVAGIAIALASVLIWLLATTLRPPFAPEAETPTLFAFLAKGAELVTLLALLLIPLLYSRAAQTTAARVLPIILIALLLGLVSGGGAYGAGLVGEKVKPSWMAAEGAHAEMGDEGDDVGTAGMSDHTTSPTPANSSTSANAAGNSSANATSDPGQPSNPGNCMVGMDMPGCTAAQADAMRRAQAAEAARRPADKTLAPVTISLDAQGAQSPGSTTLDAAVTRIMVRVTVNGTGEGAWFHAGPGGQGDMTLTFKDAAGTETPLPLDGTALTAGIEPLSSPAGTYDLTIQMPAEGALTLTLSGQGQGVDVVVHIIERFY